LDAAAFLAFLAGVPFAFEKSGTFFIGFSLK
jgi:hypothetical protein